MRALILCICFLAASIGMGQGSKAKLIGALGRPGSEAVIDQLAKMGESVLADLLATVRTGPDEARGDALRAIGRIGTRAAYDALVELMGNSDDALGAAASAALDTELELSYDKDPKVVGSGIDPDVEARRAKDLLFEYWPYTELGEYRARVCRDARSKSEAVRRDLIHWLVSKGPADVVGPNKVMTRCGNGPADPYDVAMRLASKGQRDTLLQLLRDPICNRKVLVLHALQPEDKEAAFAAAINLATDPHHARRQAAFSLIWRAERQEAEPVLLRGLTDPRNWIRYSSIHGLSDLKAVDAVERIGPLLRDKDEEIHHAALMAISELGGPHAVRIFTDAARDTDKNISGGACHGLACLNTPEAVGSLWKLYASTDPGLRYRAFAALREADSEDAFEVFRKGAADKLVEIRIKACRELPYWEDPRAEGLLVQMTKDKDEKVREAARDALDCLRPGEPPPYPR